MTTGIYLLHFSKQKYHKYYIGQSKNIEQRFDQHCKKLLSGSHTEAMQEAYRLHGHLPKLKILLECHEDYLLPMERLYAQAHRNMFTKDCNAKRYLELNTMPLLADIPDFIVGYKHKRYLRNLVCKIPYKSSLLEPTKLVIVPKILPEPDKLSTVPKVAPPQILLEPMPAYLDLF